MDTPEAPVRGRFAPSPSGRMHLGNLWSCLLAWLAARSAGGSVVLRLEDLDPERCRREYGEQIMRDLEWLGLDWDGEPVWQSERTGAYAHAFRRLEEQGLVYPCFCSRAERLAAAAPHAADGHTVYSGRCSRLSPGERQALALVRRPAWRVRVPEITESFDDLCQGPYAQELSRECGDFILRRSDGVYAYQLAVVVDDAWMGVNQVVRGRDLLSSAPRQQWLARTLGLPPPRYGHVPLLLSGDGRRLAKRDLSLDAGTLRERYNSEELVGRLALLAGLIPEYQPAAPAGLLPLFSWDKLPREDLAAGARECP